MNYHKSLKAVIDALEADQRRTALAWSDENHLPQVQRNTQQAAGAVLKHTAHWGKGAALVLLSLQI